MGVSTLGFILMIKRNVLRIRSMLSKSEREGQSDKKRNKVTKEEKGCVALHGATWMSERGGG